MLIRLYTDRQIFIVVLVNLKCNAITLTVGWLNFFSAPTFKSCSPVHPYNFCLCRGATSAICVQREKCKHRARHRVRHPDIVIENQRSLRATARMRGKVAELTSHMAIGDLQRNLQIQINYVFILCAIRDIQKLYETRFKTSDTLLRNSTTIAHRLRGCCHTPMQPEQECGLP